MFFSCSFGALSQPAQQLCCHNECIVNVYMLEMNISSVWIKSVLCNMPPAKHIDVLLQVYLRDSIVNQRHNLPFSLLFFIPGGNAE